MWPHGHEEGNTLEPLPASGSPVPLTSAHPCSHLSAEQGMGQPAGEDWKVQLSFLTVEGLSREAECVRAIASLCT